MLLQPRKGDAGCHMLMRRILQTSEKLRDPKPAMTKSGNNISLMNMFRMTAVAALTAIGGSIVGPHDANGPLAPPPEHDVHSLTTTQPMEPPPALAPAGIIKEFSAKEEQILVASV